MSKSCQAAPSNRRGRLLAHFALAWALVLAAPAFAADPTFAWTVFTPRVIDQSAPVDPLFEVKVDGGPPSAVKLLLSAGPDVVLHDDGLNGDKVAGDAIWSVKITSAQALSGYTPDRVQRNIVGFVRAFVGATEKAKSFVIADVLTPSVPPLPGLTSVSPKVQFSDHVVNLVVPGFFPGIDIPSTPSVTQALYQAFGDDYDFLSIVSEISYGKNRGHFVTRNDVQGIGFALKNDDATYGSAGRLKGITLFPMPIYFDGASTDFVHELGHQWISALDEVPALASGVPHWPLSDLATDVMGWSDPVNKQGLSLPYTLKPNGANYDLVPDDTPKGFNDLSLYLMGLLPPAQVGAHFSFVNQNQSTSGGVLLGPVTPVTVQDVIAKVGPRVPAAGQKPRYRNATVFVTQNGLATQQQMRLYDFFARRAAEEAEVQTAQGLVDGPSKPFFTATGGRARLNPRIKQRILVDSSRDGGAWWFPQSSGFLSSQPHQGKALADALRAKGHAVEELKRPTTITPERLANRDLVIRAGVVGSYTAAEIAAYKGFVQKGGRLLLLADHHANDGLASAFGITFKGIVKGQSVISQWTPHALSAGVGPSAYLGGSGVTATPAGTTMIGKIAAAGFLDLDDDGVKDANEPAAPGVLGVTTVGDGRILFCGDVNLWLAQPQPLLKNALAWLDAP